MSDDWGFILMNSTTDIALYVSPAGNDAWSGHFPDPQGSDGPLATLEEARDRLRQQRRQGRLEGAAAIWVRGGVYERRAGFELTAEDSGTPTAPVVVRAFPGETPRLMGGRRLADFAPVRDPAVLQRLPEEARPHVRQCDLKALGIADLGRLVSRGFGRPTSPAHLELFFQGQRMQVARWPNGDFARIKAPAELHPEGDRHGGQLGRLEAGFFFDGDRPRRWQSLEDVWLHGYWAWDWANSYEQLASYDPATGLIRTRPPHGLYGFKSGQRFYFLNVLEELDCPGEYYLDRRTGMLYFWPPAPLEAGEAIVSLLEEPLICIHNASHLAIEGLVLECSRGLGVQIIGGSAVSLAGCTLRLLGNHAVVVDGGSEHQVVSCDIYRTGDGGIRLSGGDRKTLTPARHRAVNNHLHHLAEWSRCYQPGILVQGVGNHLAHNLIHDHPHCAILLQGNDHLIEFNHLHHVCQETGDVGAFYLGRDWTERGNVVRYNLFHHTQGVGMGSMAVYLDDCASGTTVYGNIFCQCTRAAFIGGGRDNRIENNLFVDCHPAVMIDGRGLDPRPVWRNMIYQTMKERLEAMDPHRPPYRLRYPELLQLDQYYRGQDGVPPEGNAVIRNLCWGGEWLQIHWHAEPSMIAVQDNLIDRDPGSVDAEAIGMRLRSDPSVLALGFQPIPLERIGLYRDAHRSTLPPPVAWR